MTRRTVNVLEVRRRLIDATAARHATFEARWLAIAKLIEHAPWDLWALLQLAVRQSYQAQRDAAEIVRLRQQLEQLRSKAHEQDTWIASLESRDPAVRAMRSYVGLSPAAPKPRPRTRPGSRVAPPPVPPADSPAVSELDWADIDLADSVIAALDGEV